MDDENVYRFVAILNKKMPTGKLMNALGHMAAGLAGGFGKAESMRFLNYVDKDGGDHPNISHFGFIILKADNANQIRAVRKAAMKRNVLFTDFTDTMTVGTTQEQLDRTKQTPESVLEYFGICLFGKKTDLQPLTGKFSLFT